MDWLWKEWESMDPVRNYLESITYLLIYNTWVKKKELNIRARFVKRMFLLTQGSLSGEERKIKDWALHTWSLNPGIFVRWGTTPYCVLAAFSTAFNLC